MEMDMSNQQQLQQPSPMLQIGMLNLRINDMMTQLNIVLKSIMDENTALKRENDNLKTMSKDSAEAKQEKIASPK
jgi:hypothetical protein